jgi:hypothetical protein
MQAQISHFNAGGPIERVKGGRRRPWLIQLLANPSDIKLYCVHNQTRLLINAVIPMVHNGSATSMEEQCFLRERFLLSLFL